MAKTSMNKPNYYAILPAVIRYADDLTPIQKLLFAEITALSNKHGYCYASNKYFAELYNVSNTWISLTIKDMQKKGYLDVKLYDNNKRHILAIEVELKGALTRVKRGALTRVKHNNTSINNIINNYSVEVELNDLESETPKSYQEQKIQEISKVLGKESLPYLKKKLKDNKFWAVERVWGVFRHNEVDLNKIKNKGAYFNSMVESAIAENVEARA